MAAEVSSLIRVLGGGGYNKEEQQQQHRTVGNESHGEKSTALITRDLLGGSSIESQELDLDLQVPTGWEKRLDLQSGKVYIQKCNTMGSGSGPENKAQQVKPIGPKLEDLNIPSSQTNNVLLNLFDETSLDLKLVSSSLPSSNYQSVCTLDKVKSALERAEKEPIIRKRTGFLKSPISASSPSYSSSSSSIKETTQEDHQEIVEDKMISSPMAAGCPGCLSYVLIMKNNPKCPRCNSLVPIPSSSMKKPRIDLNISI